MAALPSHSLCCRTCSVYPCPIFMVALFAWQRTGTAGLEPPQRQVGQHPQSCTPPDRVLSRPFASSWEPRVCLGQFSTSAVPRRTARKPKGRNPRLLFISELPSQRGGPSLRASAAPHLGNARLWIHTQLLLGCPGFLGLQFAPLLNFF